MIPTALVLGIAEIVLVPRQSDFNRAGPSRCADELIDSLVSVQFEASTEPVRTGPVLVRHGHWPADSADGALTELVRATPVQRRSAGWCCRSGGRINGAGPFGPVLALWSAAMVVDPGTIGHFVSVLVLSMFVWASEPPSEWALTRNSEAETA